MTAFIVKSSTPIVGVMFETDSQSYLRVWHRKGGPMQDAVWFYHPNDKGLIWAQCTSAESLMLDTSLGDTLFSTYGVGVIARFVGWLKARLGVQGGTPPTPGA